MGLWPPLQSCIHTERVLGEGSARACGVDNKYVDVAVVSASGPRFVMLRCCCRLSTEAACCVWSCACGLFCLWRCPRELFLQTNLQHVRIRVACSIRPSSARPAGSGAIDRLTKDGCRIARHRTPGSWARNRLRSVSGLAFVAVLASARFRMNPLGAAEPCVSRRYRQLAGATQTPCRFRVLSLACTSSVPEPGPCNFPECWVKLGRMRPTPAEIGPNVGESGTSSTKIVHGSPAPTRFRPISTKLALKST